MKNTIWIAATFLLLLASCSKEKELEAAPQPCTFTNFKYYNGARDTLGELSTDYLLIGVDKANSDSEIATLISSMTALDQNYAYTIHSSGQYQFKEVPVKLRSSSSCVEIEQMMADIEQQPLVDYVHYTIRTDDCNSLIWEPLGDLCINSYGSSFFVKVLDENDRSDLNRLIAETETELVKQNEFNPRWFELRATKNAAGDALEMANRFHESGLFEYSEPGISKYPVE